MVIRKTQEDLEKALSNSTLDQEVISTLTVLLKTAYKEEELYWRQRSRILSLQSGDRNTGFFHASTRGRRAVNKISVLEDSEERAVYQEEGIVKTITKYYSQIFTAQMFESSLVVNEGISPLITTEMNQALIALPTSLEIKEALFSIHPDKTAGPDGFSASFYQSFWDVIGEDICADIRAFFETCYLDTRQNETHVRLIPKTTSARKFSEYRPIALCNTHYKIIAKLLTQ